MSENVIDEYLRTFSEAGKHPDLVIAIQKLKQEPQMFVYHDHDSSKFYWAYERINPAEMQVHEFMTEMKQVIGNEPRFRDRILREHLIRKEYEEWVKAFDEDDFVEAVDALADMAYVILGTFIAFGVDFQTIMNEVHRSNMTKNGDLKDDRGKVLKPEGWTPPDIEGYLIQMGWQGNETK